MRFALAHNQAGVVYPAAPVIMLSGMVTNGPVRDRIIHDPVRRQTCAAGRATSRPGEESADETPQS